MYSTLNNDSADNNPLQQNTNDFEDIQEMDDDDVTSEPNYPQASPQPNQLQNQQSFFNQQQQQDVTQMSSTHKSLRANGIMMNNQITNPSAMTQSKKTRVFDPPGGLRRKIKTVRCLTKKLCEYDVENDFWTPVEVKTDKLFLAFSRTVYLPN